MLLDTLNTHFKLNISVVKSERDSAGSFIDGKIHLNTLDVIKTKRGLRASRPNNMGNMLYPNVLSFAKGDLIDIVIAHEFGHAIEDSYRKDPIVSDTVKLCDRLAPGTISVYSAHNHPLSIHSEAFAETFALYIIEPHKLHQMSEQLFHAINDMYVSFL